MDPLTVAVNELNATVTTGGRFFIQKAHQTVKLMRHRPDKPPELVYHETSRTALIGKIQAFQAGYEEAKTGPLWRLPDSQTPATQG